MEKFYIARISYDRGQEYYIGQIDQYTNAWCYQIGSASWFRTQNDALDIIANAPKEYHYVVRKIEVKQLYDI